MDSTKEILLLISCLFIIFVFRDIVLVILLLCILSLVFQYFFNLADIY